MSFTNATSYLATLLGWGLLFISTSHSTWAQLPDPALGSETLYGELLTPARQFRFAVKLTPKQDGQWDGKLTSLDEGFTEFALDKLVFSPTQLEFELAATKAQYSGTRQTPEGAFEGQWHQASAKLPLNFRAVGEVPPDQPSEIWVGELNAGFQKLKVQLRVYRAGDQEPRLYFDSLSQNLGGFVGKWSEDGEQISLEVPVLRAKFAGKRNGQNTQISGEWNQGTAIPLVLARADKITEYEKKTLRRPQHPTGEPPYRVETVRFSNPDAGIDLVGTLTIPSPASSDSAEKTRYQAAILISGSGPQDRDETLLGHKPFWVLADYLTRQGIAVLRFDERGVGESTGKFETATSQDFASDVAAAWQFLANDSRIDAGNIGLIGHSEGGLVAPLVAATNPQIPWIVLLAGPGVNGEEILYSQGKLIIEASGGSPQEVLRQRLIQEVTFAAIDKIAPEDSVEEHIDPAVAEFTLRLKTALVENGTLESMEATGNFESPVAQQAIRAMIKANMEQMHTPWFRFFAKHEPGAVLKQLKCAVLALNGEKDVQVDPELNLPQIEAALLAGGNTRFETQVMPGLNHLFQTSKTGSVAEYESLEETFAPAALEAISQWILRQIPSHKK